MGKLKNLLSWPRRYRTSCGFGVHSPFAYSFITKVLCDNNAYYYAFPEIDALCGKSHRDTCILNDTFSARNYEHNEAHRLFRMLCYFNPDQIVEIGEGKEVSRLITERAVPHASLSIWSSEAPTEIDDDHTSFIIVNYALEQNFSKIRSYLLKTAGSPKGTVIFFRNMHLPQVKRLWQQITSVIDRGMTFHDDLSGVYVANKKLPRKDFEIIF
jgi:hypothetical protein